MPGPSNIKKKRKSTAKNQKKGSRVPRPSLDNQTCTSTCNSRFPSPLSGSSSQLVTPPPPPMQFPSPVKEVIAGDDNSNCYVDRANELIPQKPYIYDPGNGPRVRDTRAFLMSSYFAQPPALEDPLCAEFAQDEVLQMLRTVLPEEISLILWYNKSRATSRICPACQRLYHLGDVLPDLMDSEHERINKNPPPQLERERELSGLCSPVCFILASFNYPGAIKSAWGCTADEMDDRAWVLLNSPGEGHTRENLSSGLGMLVKMTRLHDLGLAQLCLPDVDFGEPTDGESRINISKRSEVAA